MRFYTKLKWCATLFTALLFPLTLMATSLENKSVYEICKGIESASETRIASLETVIFSQEHEQFNEQLHCQLYDPAAHHTNVSVYHLDNYDFFDEINIRLDDSFVEVEDALLTEEELEGELGEKLARYSVQHVGDQTVYTFLHYFKGVERGFTSAGRKSDLGFYKMIEIIVHSVNNRTRLDSIVGAYIAPVGEKTIPIIGTSFTDGTLTQNELKQSLLAGDYDLFIDMQF